MLTDLWLTNTFPLSKWAFLSKQIDELIFNFHLILVIVCLIRTNLRILEGGYPRAPPLLSETLCTKHY